MKVRPRHTQIGDTIVEVLISVAVISSVLAGAFSLSQRSSATVRDSQERSEVLHVLQGQVELLRNLTLTETTDSGTLPPSSPFATSPKYFCIDPDPASPNYKKRITSSALGSALPSLASDNYSGYANPCKNVQGHYNIAINYEGNGLFKFSGRWDRVNGGKDQSNFVYRIYPGAGLTATPPGPSGPGAAIGSTPCTTDPLTGLCTPPPDPPQYRWTRWFTNLSSNPSKTVSGCLWEFLDGSPNETDACALGAVQAHTYAQVPGLAPYPIDCQKFSRDVKLTMYFTDGTNAVTNYPTTVPDCW